MMDAAIEVVKDRGHGNQTGLGWTGLGTCHSVSTTGCSSSDLFHENLAMTDQMVDACVCWPRVRCMDKEGDLLGLEDSTILSVRQSERLRD